MAFFGYFLSPRKESIPPEASRAGARNSPSPPSVREVRLSKKPVIASQSADWRGNPFPNRTILRFSANLQLKDYGFPRRFAPRSKYPWGAPRNDRKRRPPAGGLPVLYLYITPPSRSVHSRRCCGDRPRRRCSSRCCGTRRTSAPADSSAKWPRRCSWV